MITVTDCDGDHRDVRPLGPEHASAAAELHRRGIDQGFLSALGAQFLTEMYRAVPACASGFGYVFREPGGPVLGFIACAESTGRLYKEALARRGVFMALALVRFAVRPAVVRRIVETLRYPAEAGDDLPPAEVVSIAVSASARGKGVGKALMAAAFEEFRRRGIARAKVAVWDENAPANRFYRRTGFELAVHRAHHGLGQNIYVVDLA